MTVCKIILGVLGIIAILLVACTLLHISPIIAFGSSMGVSNGPPFTLNGYYLGSALLPIHEGDYVCHHYQNYSTIHQLINITSDNEYVFWAYSCETGYITYTVNESAVYFRVFLFPVTYSDNCTEVYEIECSRLGEESSNYS